MSIHDQLIELGISEDVLGRANFEPAQLASLHEQIISMKAFKEFITATFVEPWQLQIVIGEDIEYKDHIIQYHSQAGWSFAHYAACSKSVNAFNWILHNKPKLLYTKTNNTSSIALIAAMIGNLSALLWIKRNKPIILDALGSNNINLANIAARNGNIELLQWLLDNNPVSLTSPLGETFLDSIPEARNSADLLQWAHEKTPLLFEAYFAKAAIGAIDNGYTDFLMWAAENATALLDTTNAVEVYRDYRTVTVHVPVGKEIAQYAAKHGDLDLLKKIPAKFLKQVTREFATYISRSPEDFLDNIELRKLVFRYAPDALDTKIQKVYSDVGKVNFNLAYVAMARGLADELSWLAEKRPKLFRADYALRNRASGYIYESPLEFAVLYNRTKSIAWASEKFPKLFSFLTKGHWVLARCNESVRTSVELQLKKTEWLYKTSSIYVPERIQLMRFLLAAERDGGSAILAGDTPSSIEAPEFIRKALLIYSAADTASPILAGLKRAFTGNWSNHHGATICELLLSPEFKNKPFDKELLTSFIRQLKTKITLTKGGDLEAILSLSKQYAGVDIDNLPESTPAIEVEKVVAIDPVADASYGASINFMPTREVRAQSPSAPAGSVPMAKPA